FVSDLITATGSQLPGLGSLAEVRGAGRRLAGFSDAAEQHRRQLKAFLFRHLYHHPDLVRENRRAEQTVAAVFGHFMARPEALPPAYRQQASQQPPQRVICDYLAGMTDSFISQIQRQAG
ncbi:MAG: deoxyguanosinetriphosphate triphosphohydrolase, partial [Terriglobales bacterium]